MGDTRTLHRAFAGGEQSPEMFARPDDPYYQNGAATMRNFVCKPHGPAVRRPGTEIMHEVDDSSKSTRIIPFDRAPGETCVIEMGEGYFRFIKEGTMLPVSGMATALGWVESLAASDWTGGVITVADPDPNEIFHIGQAVRLTSTGGTWPPPLEEGVTYYVKTRTDQGATIDLTLSTYKNGPAVTWSGTTGADLTGKSPIVRGRYEPGDVTEYDSTDYYCIEAHNADTSTNRPDQTGADSYWYEITGTELKLPHPFTEAELFDVDYVQSNDVITFVHKNHRPFELRRYGWYSWGIRKIEFGPTLEAPTGVAVTEYYGEITTIDTVRPVDPGNSAPTTTALLRCADDTPHHLAPGATLRVVGLSDETGIADGDYVAVDTGRWSNYELTLKARGTGAYVTTSSGSEETITGGSLRQVPLSQDTSNTYVVTAVTEFGHESLPSSEVSSTDNVLYVEGAYNTLEWQPVADADKYRVYKQQNGVFGYIGEVDADQTLEFVDDNIAPDMRVTPRIQDERLDESSASVTITGSTDIVTWTGHGMADLAPVRFLGLSAGTGLTEQTIYFAVVQSADTFKVVATEDVEATPVDLLADGTGTAYTGDYPSSVCYFEQRRVFGGTRLYPQGVWATRTGTESDLNYSIPSRTDDSIAFEVASRRATPIRHLVPMGHLVALTDAAEYRLTPLQSDVWGPETVSSRLQGSNGASSVRPVASGDRLVYCAARGGRVREMGFDAASQGFAGHDLSLRAAHLFEGYDIVDMAEMKAPHPIVWCVSSSGDLLGLTFLPDQHVAGWHKHTLSGEVESCCVVSEDDEDRLYVVVKRTIQTAVNPGVKRYIERLSPFKFGDLENAVFVDSALTQTITGTTVSGLSYLEGETVDAFADGAYDGEHTVTSGAITLNTSVTSATVTVGYPIASTLRTMPFTAQMVGWGSGRRKNVERVDVRVAESMPFEAGPSTDTDELAPLGVEWATAGELQNGVAEVPVYGEWNADGQITIYQDEPYPLTVVGITLHVALGG